MNRKLFAVVAAVILIAIVIFWENEPKKMNVSNVLSLVQREYHSITINDKNILAGTSKQYLIDDFIPKLSRYTIETYEGKLPENNDYEVKIQRNDGGVIILLDNDYMIIDNRNYIIIDGTIDLGKFYSFID